MQSDDLKMERFVAAESSQFTITDVTPEGAVVTEIAARLDRVTPGVSAAGYEQYALLFTGPRSPLLPQGTYRFRHDQLGDLPLFMVPVGQDAKGTQYEVCVARKLG